jgi:hypothetical protein
MESVKEFWGPLTNTVVTEMEGYSELLTRIYEAFTMKAELQRNVSGPVFWACHFLFEKVRGNPQIPSLE